MLEPLIIFALRVTGITCGTFRLIAIRDKKIIPAVLWSFVEMIFFCCATGMAILDWKNPFNVAAYACGFSLGTYIAMKIDARRNNVGNGCG